MIGFPPFARNDVGCAVEERGQFLAAKPSEIALEQTLNGRSSFRPKGGISLFFYEAVFSY